MTDRLRLALAPLNPRPGAVTANAARIRAARAEAAAGRAELLATPEFSLGGWPPGQLAGDPVFQAACAATLAELAAETADGGPGILLGGPWPEGGRLHDAIFLLDAGQVLARRARHHPPRESLFDPGPAPGPVVFRGIRLGLMAGEDWQDPAVPETLLESGAEILLALHASPFARGLPDRRIDLAVARVVETGLPFAALGQAGGQDGLVGDGGTFVLNADRSLALRLPPFTRRMALTAWHRAGDGWACAPQPLPAPMPEEEQLWRALMLGLADQLEKNGTPGVLVPLAGDLRSALSAACAVDALGPARVRAVLLPAPGDDPGRLEQAARLLGIACDSVPIAPALEAFGAMLAGQGAADLRRPTRLATLLALAEGSGALLLDGRDKSALALGQDGAGGFGLLHDLWPGELRALARWRNAGRPAGALGPQGPALLEELLAHPLAGEAEEPILRALVEEGAHPDMLVERGFARATVSALWRSLHRGEYKRRQAPPGVMLGRHAFGRDRRYPLTNGLADLIP